MSPTSTAPTPTNDRQLCLRITSGIGPKFVLYIHDLIVYADLSRRFYSA